MILALRIGAIAIGVILFVVAEMRDAANEKKPYSSGTNRYGTFYDDATVLGLRLAAVGFVAVTLLTWVIGNRGASLL